MRSLDLWYARSDVAELAARWTARASASGQRFEQNLAKSRAKDSLKAFSRMTEIVDGEPRIISDPPLIVPIEELSAGARARSRGRSCAACSTPTGARCRAIAGSLLERFRFVDAARKVVGVGSVGTRAWIVLLLGRDDNDPLFLQFKEAQASVLQPFLGKSEFANQGQRVVEGQRLTQAASDIMLGWIRTTGLDDVKRDFYVRQLWDAKGTAIIELMDTNAMSAYARVCGGELARAHARSGDAVAIASYLGNSDTFDRALALFAESYADQNERDYEALADAVKSGRIKAESGVYARPGRGYAPARPSQVVARGDLPSGAVVTPAPSASARRTPPG